MRLINADAYAYPGDLVNEPTIDAVEVVRCEKCRFGNYLSGVKKYECHNPLYAERNTHRGQHFCSYGERKENATD